MGRRGGGVPSVVAGWRRGIVLFLAIVTLSACGGDGSSGDDPSLELDSGVRFSELPAYRGVSFADALQAEQRNFAGHLRRDRVTGTTSGTFEGRYTTVEAGVRRTVRSECPGCRRRSVWLVGGSVAFGLGQRDSGSVASALVRLAAADGVLLDVTNLAVPGWTVGQSAAAVEERLASGAPGPDLIVDIGGFNDVVAAFVTLGVGREHPDAPLVLDPSAVQRFEDGRVSLAEAGGAVAVADFAVEHYSAGRERIARSARERGIATRFYFHPDALSSPTQLRPVRDVVRGLRRSRASELRSILDRVAPSLAPSTRDLRDLYDDLDESVFVDWAHTNEAGAALLAEAVYRDLGPVLDGALEG